MRVELTIRTATGDHDVAIETSPATTVATIRQRLIDLLSLEPACALMLGGRPLELSAPLSATGLRTGAVLTAGVAPDDPLVSASLALRVVGGPCAGTVVPLARGRFTIGRDRVNDVVLADERVSRRHASLDVSAGGTTITDHGSTNGTLLDGAVVVASGAAVDRDAQVRLGDSLLMLTSSDLAPAALTVTPTALLVNRPPRRALSATGPREIGDPAPIATAKPRPVQWSAALVPAVAAGGLAWFTHSPIFLLFGLMSPVMVLAGALGDRLHRRGTRRSRGRAERRRRARAQDELAAALRDETLARRAGAPDPAALLLVASAPASRLWERRSYDPDLLTVRIGVADRPSALVVRSGSTRLPAGQVIDVPVVVDLRAGPLGVVGPPSVTASVVRWLVGQLAILHPPGVVDLALLLSPESADWTWARWLPHVAGRVGVNPEQWAAVVADLPLRAGHRPPGPDPVAARDDRWAVVVIDRADQLGDAAGLGPLLAGGILGGVSAIYVAPARTMLPAACVSVVTVDDDVGTRLTLHHGDERVGDIRLDGGSVQWAEQVSRALAPLADATSSGPSTLPPTCSLSAVLGGEIDATSVRQRWTASNGRPDTAIGLGPDGVVTIDLLRDGPHALIAGTTGAGKSQLLQSLVAGLAVRHPPDEVTFLLIDYKGGAAFAECARLPHTAGVVTDLDPHLTRRALRSLTAELSRRERLFASARAEDLEAYRATRPGEPVARLVIVVDEFAALATELPDFLHGIVGVARRGRSLGVHLVLATQRPGQAVTPEIRANTSLRIALRVTDVAESSDLVQAPDAALVPRDRPGRAVLRCGDRMTTFQTARPVSVAAADLVVERLDAWRRARPAGQGEDGLRHIVDAVSSAARSTGRSPARSPWRDPLPSTLELRPAGSADRVALALVDQPDTQTQSTLEVDLSRPTGVLIAGAPGSGRTTALVTLALAAATARAPDALAIHLIDSAGRLRTSCGRLPQVGTAIGAGEAGLVAALLRRLANQRQPAAPTLLLIDGWDQLLADCDDAEALRLDARLTALLRSARESLVTVVATGDRSVLLPRAAAAFDTRLVLRLADRADYGLVSVARGDVPERLPPGRGVRGADGAEFQILRAAAPAATVEQVRALWTGYPADPALLRLRALPRQLALAELPRVGNQLVLGLAGTAATPLSLDPFAGSRRWLVAGPARSGKSTTLCTVLAEALRVGLNVIVAAPPRSPLTRAAQAASFHCIAPGDTDLGSPPAGPTILLVDDSDAFHDTRVSDHLGEWARTDPPQLAIVLAGRCEDLVTAYRGLAAEVRRSRSGILLRPGPVDGELFGLRLDRRRAGSEPPGRGLVAGHPIWESDDGEPTPIQVACP